MAVKLPVLCVGRPLPPGRFLVLISVRGWVDLREIVRLEGLGQFKNEVGNRIRNFPACRNVPQTYYVPACPPLADNTTVNLAYRTERNLCKYYLPTNGAVVACCKLGLNIFLGEILAVIANNCFSRSGEVTASTQSTTRSSQWSA
jgi:hypothetical protein